MPDTFFRVAARGIATDNMSLKYRRIATVAALIMASACRMPGQIANSFSPPLGSAGEQININGNGFSGSTSGGTLRVVFGFNGPLSPNAQATSSSLIIATIPSGAITGPVGIWIFGGQTNYSTPDFVVIGPGPYITNFAPTVGSASGGLQVTIQGVHFQSGGATNAYFNGQAAAHFFLQTDHSILVTNPVGTTSGPISVRSVYGTAGTTNNTFTAPFFYVPPSISGFSPASGRMGSNVVITGANFLSTTAVSFDAITASSFTVLSNGAVQASVPTNATTGAVRVTAPAGSALSSSAFTVPPTIYGFSPNFGSIGTSITITGANFNVGTPTVRFNGVSASLSGTPSFSQLTAVVPSTTTGPISVTTSDGSDTNAALFYLPARITSFTPTNSGPGSTATITGTNFLGATAVSFNGVSASFTPPTNNTTVVTTVPGGFTTGPISVTTPAGTTNSSGLFYAPPTISGFAPTHGLPGTNVIITGSNFLGATAVLFAGTNAGFTVLSNAAIHATVPNNAHTGPITVIAPAGTNTSASSFVLDYSSDIQVSMSAAPSPVFVTSNLVYTISIANNGPFATTGISLTNTLPATVTLRAADTTQGTLATNGNPILASIGNLGIGGSATVTLTVVPQAAGTITNIASAGSDFSDPTPANNAFTNTVIVLPLPLLSIQRASSNRVNVSWPVALSNFVLEYRTNVSMGASWSSNAALPAVFTNQNVITETATNPAKFYRLRK
jgi:hypothetical protein